MKIRAEIRRFLTDEEGASAIEYALIAGIIGALLVTVLGAVSGGITNAFTAITDALNSVGGGG